MGRRRTNGAKSISGVLVLDKPKGLTSFQAVARLRRLSGADRVGHTGTLDPLATGLLPICFGETTKIASLLSGSRKSYIAQAELGVTTDTYDSDGTVTGRTACQQVQRDDVMRVLTTFVGEAVSQKPPAFSAIHVNGQRAYELARRGEVVDLAPRMVEIASIALVHWEGPCFSILVTCGSGTYIRSLIHDIGQVLGVGAMLTGLRRTRVANFDERVATTMDAIEHVDPANWPWLSLEEALMHADPAVPKVTVSASEAAQLRHGQPLLRHTGMSGVAWAACDGLAVALGQQRGASFWPVRVFAYEGA